MSVGYSYHEVGAQQNDHSFKPVIASLGKAAAPFLAREINRFPDRSGTVFCFAECRLLQPIAAGKQKTLKPYLPRRNKLHKAMGTLLPLVSFTDTGTLFAAIFVATRAV